jgi:hypothetical protein
MSGVVRFDGLTILVEVFSGCGFRLRGDRQSNIGFSDLVRRDAGVSLIFGDGAFQPIKRS